VIDKHDNGHLGPDVPDLVGDGCAIQEAQVVFENDSIHVPRHKKP
jgi:hypothetical protein